MTHIVYMLECRNGSYYTGYTTDIERRYNEHEKGTLKCRYTRSFPPKKILVYWKLSSRSEALSIEAKIKKLSKPQKKLLIDVKADTLNEYISFLLNHA